jgi:hypothetical protein
VVATVGEQGSGNTFDLNKAIDADLKKSGITHDIAVAVGIRPSTMENVVGYEIPYYDTKGKKNGFYRVKVLNTQSADLPKYLQRQNSGTHAYLAPATIVAPTVWQDTSQPLIIAEGEKKALAVNALRIRDARRNGQQNPAEATLRSERERDPGLFGSAIPAALALGGVNNWKQRTYRFSKNLIKATSNSEVVVKFKGEDSEPKVDEQIADELLHIEWYGRKVYLVFDQDPKAETRQNVQASAFELALWLDERGAEVVQVLLPEDANQNKAGLDDWLVTQRDPGTALQELLDSDGWTFPVIPHIGPWVVRQLQSRKRNDKAIARAIIAGLDAKGQRFIDTSAQEIYYLDRSNGHTQLHSMNLGDRHSTSRMTGLGRLLIGEYKLPTIEKDVFEHFADIYTTRGARDTTARAVTWCSEDGSAMYYHLDRDQVAKVTAEDIVLQPNGKEILFRGQVDDLDIKTLTTALGAGFKGRWVSALSTLNLSPLTGMAIEDTRLILSALFHLSPWLRRWRGLMLPIELCVGEPGSGKSFLYNLRRAILTGNPSLDRLGFDVRDWTASVVNAPGLWVGDNMNEIPRAMRQEVESELARLITDPHPAIAQRILFTNTQQAVFHIDCVFATTAISLPFHKPDVIQRCLTFHLNAIPKGQLDGMWYQRQIQNGGRERWVAEHLLAVHQFLKFVKADWSDTYASTHRLAHFEQSMALMLRVVGDTVVGPKRASELVKTVGAEQTAQEEPQAETKTKATKKQAEVVKAKAAELVKALSSVAREDIVEADAAIEGLKEFGLYWWETKGRAVARVQDVVDWVHNDINARYMGQYHFKNVFVLGRYLKQFTQVIEDSANLRLTRRHNQTCILANASGRGHRDDDDDNDNDTV